MTKQEEIREHLIELFEQTSSNEEPCKLADAVLWVLNEDGVVLKVDRKLPQLRELRAKIKQWDGKDRGEPAVRGMYQERPWIAEGVQQDMLNAGYVAVKPLVDELLNEVKHTIPFDNTGVENSQSQKADIKNHDTPQTT